MRPLPHSGPLLAASLALALAGCSIRDLAVNALARSLGESGDVYASDEDPELVRDATPFALKTMEALLAEKPDHEGLLLGACRGFTQYSYAFVESDADRLEEVDYEAAERGFERALQLYLRARDYCLRGLEMHSPGVQRRLESAPATALGAFGVEQVPLLFWSAASWGAAISVGLDRPDVTVDLPAVRALIDRVAELDERYGDGAVHELLMVLELLPRAMGGDPERASRHFERAVELSGGQAAGVYVSLAVGLALPEQDREQFEALLAQALAVDPDAAPSMRLANVLAQRRARWLLERADELFL